MAAGQRTVPNQRRWPRLLIGAVLLARALCATAVTLSGDLDSTRLAEWTSPGLGRSVKLVFAGHGAFDTPTLPSTPTNLRRANRPTSRAAPLRS